MRNDESWRRVPARFTIWLTCGCSVRKKDLPMGYRVTYPCPNGMGHGYRLRWTRWVDDRDGSGYNPEVQG